MKTVRWLLFGATIALVTAIAVFAVTQRTKSTEESAMGDRQPDPNAEDESTSAISAGPQRRANLVPVPMSGPKTPEPPKNDAPAQPPASTVPPTVLARDLQIRLTSEPVDASWAEPTRGALTTDLYAARIDHTSVQNVRCGSTLCEVTLQHDDAVEPNTVPTAVGSRPLFAAGAFYWRDEANNRTTIFVARPGHQLFGAEGRVALAE